MQWDPPQCLRGLVELANLETKHRDCVCVLRFLSRRAGVSGARVLRQTGDVMASYQHNIAPDRRLTTIAMQSIANPRWGSLQFDPEEAAKRLADSGNYRILRRLRPRDLSPPPTGYAGKVGLLIDLETTGLDPVRDEVIELAALKFRYSDTDEISGVSSLFQSFNQPSKPIPAQITSLTGITDEMVAGAKIDAMALEGFVGGANIVIAHNAAFDRPFAEQNWKFFARLPWACSASGIDWRSQGYEGSRLGYLLAGTGYFHNAHRATDDCQALLEILTQPLGHTEQSAFATLMAAARRPTVRIWAERSPFDLKDILKRRGYRWNDGSDGRLRSWYTDVDDKDREAELTFLRTEIYQREIEITCREITAFDRYSIRA